VTQLILFELNIQNTPNLCAWKTTVKEGHVLMLKSNLSTCLGESCLFQIDMVLVTQTSCMKLSEVVCQRVFML